MSDVEIAELTLTGARVAKTDTIADNRYLTESPILICNMFVPVWNSFMEWHTI